MEKTSSPVESLAFRLSKAGAAVTALYGTRIAPLGLRPNLVGLLAAAAANPGAHQADLGRQFGVGPSAVVPLVDELEGLGLVVRERDPADRRRSTVALTAPGRDALAQAGARARALDLELTAGLDPEEVGLVERALGAILAQADPRTSP